MEMGKNHNNHIEIQKVPIAKVIVNIKNHAAGITRPDFIVRYLHSNNSIANTGTKTEAQAQPNTTED